MSGTLEFLVKFRLVWASLWLPTQKCQCQGLHTCFQMLFFQSTNTVSLVSSECANVNEGQGDFVKCICNTDGNCFWDFSVVFLRQRKSFWNRWHAERNKFFWENGKMVFHPAESFSSHSRKKVLSNDNVIIPFNIQCKKSVSVIHPIAGRSSRFRHSPCQVVEGFASLSLSEFKKSSYKGALSLWAPHDPQLWPHCDPQIGLWWSRKKCSKWLETALFEPARERPISQSPKRPPPPMAPRDPHPQDLYFCIFPSLIDDIVPLPSTNFRASAFTILPRALALCYYLLFLLLHSFKCTTVDGKL